MGLFSVPREGFVSLWPLLDLGSDKAIALYSVGCRKDCLPHKATGFASVISTVTLSGVRLHAHRLKSSWLPHARTEAVHVAQGRPATILKAVGRGRVTVWQRIESIEDMTDAQAETIALAKEIRMDGELVEKMNPRNKANVSQFVSRMATTVTNDLSKAVKGPLNKYVTELTSMTGSAFEDLNSKQFNDIWQEASKSLSAGVNLGYGLAAPGLTQKIRLSVGDIANKNKDLLKETLLPKLQTSFSQPDWQAIERIGDQAGFWIRDSAGQISDKVSEKGRKIIQEGLQQGQGRDEIAKRLKEQLPEMWQKYGYNYAFVVAANAVSRARSYSEVASYASVGINYMEVVAMLDERTTDICRVLDGSIIEVSTALNHQKEIANMQDPKDIRKVAPFLSEKTNKKDGTKQINIAGSKLATVTQSGKGNADDRGKFNLHMATKKMTDKGVTMPPYHHNCRSMTVARVEMVQVPKKYDPHTEPIASTNDEKPPKKPTPSAPMKPKPQQRPVTMMPMPTPKKPVSAGSPTKLDPPIKKTPTAPPKKTMQEPIPQGPQNLKEYNLQAQTQLDETFGQKVKVTDVGYKNGKMWYEFEDPSGSGLRDEIQFKVPPGQQKKMQSSIWSKNYRDRKKRLVSAPKHKAPKVETHSVTAMRRSKISRSAQSKENSKYTRRFDNLPNDSVNARNVRMVNRLANDPEWRKYGKYTGETPTNIRNHIEYRWASTSRDTDRRMHYYQLAVKEEFGLPDEVLTPLHARVLAEIRGEANFEKTLKGYRAVARAQYAETQEMFKKQGTKSVTLFRGMDPKSRTHAPKGSTYQGIKEDVAITTQPISSHTTNIKKAHSFANGRNAVVVKQEVPVERILGNHESGLGTDYETEFVVIGGKDDFAESVSWGYGQNSVSMSDLSEKLLGD